METAIKHIEKIRMYKIIAQLPQAEEALRKHFEPLYGQVNWDAVGRTDASRPK